VHMFELEKQISQMPQWHEINFSTMYKCVLFIFQLFFKQTNKDTQHTFPYHTLGVMEIQSDEEIKLIACGSSIR
jgi:hypothetical protein